MRKWPFRKEVIFAERSISLLNRRSLQQIGWAKSLRSKTYRLLTFSLGLAVGLSCSVGARSDDTDPPTTVPPKATEEHSAPQAKTVAKVTPLLTFPQIMRANFPKWDKNGDDQLDRKEVNALVPMPYIKGRVAAAVATLHLYLREHPQQATIPKSDVVPAADGTAGLNLDKVFNFYYRHISRTKREVFAENCVPSIESISQGSIGDCFFLAAVGSAINRDPKLVQQMLRPFPNGSAEVAFPGGPKLRVRRMSDTEIALTSTAENQGMWLNILEKAYGQGCLISRIRGPKRQSDDLDIDIIARGGDARRTIELFSEHIGTLIKFRNDEEEKLPPPEDEMPGLRNKIHRLMISRVQNHSLMVAGTTAGHLLPGINAHHDYSVLGYDAEQRIVHLWNPNGKSSGAGSAHPTNHGSLDLPLDDFLKSFGALIYETDVTGLRLGRPRPVAPLGSGPSS
jgi:hypothetical protein